MPDQRTEAARARAVALLVLERNRLTEAIADQEDSLELCRHLGVPAFQITAAERRIELLRRELAELTPSRRLVGQEATRR
jgi:hypothetical protein